MSSVGLHLPQVRFGAVQRGLVLIDRRLVDGLVDRGQHGVLFDVRPVIDFQVRDQAVHLGPDVDDLLRLEGPRGLDRGQHVAALDLGRSEVRRALATVVPDVIEGSCPGQAEEDYDGKNGSHGVTLDLVGVCRLWFASGY